LLGTFSCHVRNVITATPCINQSFDNNIDSLRSNYCFNFDHDLVSYCVINPIRRSRRLYECLVSSVTDVSTLTMERYVESGIFICFICPETQTRYYVENLQYYEGHDE